MGKYQSPDERLNDDAAISFVHFVNNVFPKGMWNKYPYELRTVIEQAFEFGYKEGRKDA